MGARERKVFRHSIAVASVAIMVGLAGCYSERQYRGPGQLVDNGVLALKGRRYVLTLAEVPIATPRQHQFELANLPPGYLLNVGLRINAPRTAVEESTTVVSMSLARDGRDAISVRAVLGDWVLTTARGSDHTVAYLRQSTGETEVDCSFGTYFVAKKDASYTLNIDVQSSSLELLPPAVVEIEDVGTPEEECA